MAANDDAYQDLSTSVVYENRWMRVREDRFTRADGSRGLYGVVEKPDFALIVPLAPDGLWLVEQRRHPVDARHWEFPQGSWEEDPGVDPAVLAAAELAEETGLRAGTLTFVGRIYPAYGYADQGCRIWVATDLRAVPRAPSVEEQDLVARQVSYQQWADLLARGVIVDASSLAAWTLLRANPVTRRLLPPAAASVPRSSPDGPPGRSRVGSRDDAGEGAPG